MARARNIKPGVCLNKKLSKLSPHARILFRDLPMFTDHKGRMVDDHETIGVQIFPYERDLNVDEMLDQLHINGFVLRYAGQPFPGQDPTQTRFLWIVNFCKHQNPHKKERDKESIYPEYRENAVVPEIPGQVPVTTGPRTADSLTLIPDSGSLIADTHPTDPNFKESKYTMEELLHLTSLATTLYKNTQFPHDVQPWIINLLGSVSSEVIEKAIRNAAAVADQDHKYRKDFKNMFVSAEVVEEIAKRSFTASQTAYTGISQELQDKLKRMQEERDGNG